MTNRRSIFRVRMVTKIMIFIVLLGVVVMGLFYFLYSLVIMPEIDLQVKNRLLVYSEIAASMVDGDKHQRISEANLGEQSAEYQEILKVFETIITTNPMIDSIYTMVPTNDPSKVRFVVDSFESKDRNGDGLIEQGEMKAEIGEEYDAFGQTALLDGFTGPSVDKKPVTDKWGTFISAYAPIKNFEGKVVAAVGVDVRSEDVIKKQEEYNRWFLLYMGIVMLMVIGEGMILTRVIVGAIGGLNKSILNISEAGSTDLLDESGGDEISMLSKTINILVVGLRKATIESDKKVTEKTANLEEKVEELEKLNKLMVGREVKMFEMKKKLKEYENTES